MQATQSNKATDFLDPDLDRDSFGPLDTATFEGKTRDSNSLESNAHDDNAHDSNARNGRIRDLPSPFTAPIQAARKYLERQRGGSQQAERGRNGLDGGGEGLIPSAREQASSAQDRRLERSLYEGHSIEAGLQFGEPHGFAVNERAYFVDSDGSEPRFSYASPYAVPDTDLGPVPEPDPEAVRGAIFRLAQESRAKQESAAKQELLAPSLAARQSKSKFAPQASDALQISSEQQGQAGYPADFADVARRVWGSDRGEDLGAANSPATEFLSSQKDDSRDRLPRSTPAGTSADASYKTVATDDGDYEWDSERDSERFAPPQHGVSPRSAYTQAARIPTPQVDNQLVQDVWHEAAQSGETGRQETALQGAVSSPAGAPSAVAPESLPSVEGQNGSAFEDAALAHDACNLLSGLGLYSDLLNSPGVLAEQHRHYAEELKLIAGRSKRLIDRLLKLDETPQTRESAAATAVKTNAKGSTGVLVRTAPDAPGLVDSPHRLGTEDAMVYREIAPARSVQMGIHMTPRPVETYTGRSTGNAGEPGPGAPLTDAASPRAEAVAATAATVPSASDSEALPGTSLTGLLMRWGSLLSTLAHGTLDLSFGPQAATPVPVAAEPLERILVNLVRNARAATVAGGSIRIGVGACLEEPDAMSGLATTGIAPGSGHSMVLTVDDSGCGMTEAQVKRILDAASGAQHAGLAGQPHYDRTGGSEPPERQGLGLQVVKELVRASGGRLAIQSQLGRGTRIEIRWPVQAAALAAAGPVEAGKVNPIGRAVAETAPNPAPAVTLRAVAASAPKPVVGPDGFSEVELRAMMLRLHRTSTPETVQAERTPGVRAAGAPSRFDTDNYAAVKGAIAC